MKTAYIAVDLHARNFVQGVMNEQGHYMNEVSYPAGESGLIRGVVRIKARKKIFVVESTSSAFWAARTIAPYVDQVIICDARENALISTNARKNDSTDAYNLCRLARLGELKGVYRPEEDHRGVFKTAVLQYLDFRRQQVALKQKIKAKYREYGVFDLTGQAVYSKKHRQRYLERLPEPAIVRQLELLYELLDSALRVQKLSRQEMFTLGGRYPEIAEFAEMPGMGRLNAHIFDGLLQTPHRFKKKSQLWRHAKLGIRDRRSDGKPLGRQKLDKAGVGELKALSHQTWLGALRRRDDNEVKAFYLDSLERTGSSTKARLNTQRKILACLWTIWRQEISYDPLLFYDDS